MKIKLKIDINQEFDFSESDYTMPIIINRTMILGVYDVNFFEMTDNIWRQLPEEYKKKIYKHNWKKFIKNMVIIITDITAYSFSFNYNNKQKENIAMEEIYKNFDKNKEINCFITGCDFPNSSMSVYFQYLGEVYAEVELDDIVAISNKNTFKDYFVELEKEYNRKKNREENLAKLEQIYNKQLIVKSLVNKNINELSKEEAQKVLDDFLLIDNLKYLLEVIKKSKEYEIIISDKLKNEIKHWLRDIQIKIKTEEEEKMCQEIKEFLKEQL
ncbi:stage V sporulation protein K [Fusobacterium sp.]|uniref:stage V sporulation protein K n=1 Tax=Fusobacterium sp. TaxID=68766 RepID=UPI002A823D5B|nr:stage V sporulation protein K [Fusobacterium sp.]